MTTEEFKTELTEMLNSIEEPVVAAVFRMICGFDYEEESETYQLEFALLDEEEGVIESLTFEKSHDEDDVLAFAEEAIDVAASVLADHIELPDEIEYVSE